VGYTETEEQAYELEESAIKEHAAAERVSLANQLCSRETLAKLIQEFPEYENKKLLPEYAEEHRAALAARTTELWDDPDYSRGVICNNPRNLDYETVMAIRLLAAMGEQPRAIAKKLDIDPGRTKSVIRGATYSRVY